MKTHLTLSKTTIAKTHKMNRIYYFCFSILMLSLVACSDNDQSDSGANTEAKITNGNALMFMAGTQASQQSIANSTNGSAGSSTGSSASKILGLLTPNSGSANSSPAPSVFGLIGILEGKSCGGSYAIANNGTPFNLNVSLTFTGFCIDNIVEKLTLDGILSISTNASEFTISFIELSISGGDINETLNCAMTINMATGNVSNDTCSTLGNGTDSSDGNSISISGDNTIGFTIEGSIVNDGEYVTLSTPEPLFFDLVACRGKPIAGLIQIEGSEGSRATANFSDGDNDCGTIEFCVFQDSEDPGSCTTQISL